METNGDDWQRREGVSERGEKEREGRKVHLTINIKLDIFLLTIDIHSDLGSLLCIWRLYHKSHHFTIKRGNK